MSLLDHYGEADARPPVRGDLDRLLAEAHAAGVTLWAEGDRLNYRATGGVGGDLLAKLKAARHDLIGHPDLQRRLAPPRTAAIPEHLWEYWCSVQRGDHGAGYANATHFVAQFPIAFEPERLSRAVAALMRRHEILSARMAPAGEREHLCCDVTVEAVLSHFDLSACEPEAAPAALAERAEQLCWRPFDPTAALFRVFLIALPGEKSALGLVIHHFVADDHSVNVAVRDLLSLYAGQEAAPARPPPQYIDHLRTLSARVEGEAASTDLAYWRESLRGAPATTLRGPTPGDSNALADPANCSFEIDDAVVRRLEAICGARDATLFMGLLAVSAMVFARLSGQPDLVFGVHTDGRYAPGLWEAVGRFGNSVLLRLAAPEHAKFLDVLDGVRRRYVTSLPHWIFPYQKVHGEARAVGEGHDAPVLFYRDRRPLEALTHNETEGELLYAACQRLHPKGVADLLRATPQAYPNFFFALHRTRDGLIGQIVYLPLTHAPTVIQQLADAVVQGCRELADGERVLDATSP